MRPSPRLLVLSASLLLLLILPLAAQAQSFCDFAPGVTVTATNGAVGVPVFVQVTASDPNGDAITSLTADTSALPAGNNAVFTANASNTAGTLTWTPQAGQTGNFTVTYTAANALSGSATATIHVVDTAGAPFVQCPISVPAWGGGNVTFDVYAGDPDGEPIASLTASPMPVGATFTVDPGNAHGVFSWTPGFTSSGATVTFTATNSMTGSSSALIYVPQADRPPLVYAPATVSGTENHALSICVLASDPDGQALFSLTASPLPAGATFTSSPANTAGTFSWTPSFTQAGTYNVTFTSSNSLSGVTTTAITIANVDRTPVVTAPPTTQVCKTTLLTFTVTASDPDGDAITSLTASGTPMTQGATFTAGAGNTSGTFSWTPTFTAGGTYNVTFTAQNALTSTAGTAITVNNCDRPPIVTAPATATAVANALLTFTVFASDPDGDPILSLTAAPLPSGATFTANVAHTSGTFSWTPICAQAGTYSVTFTASNALSSSATTVISLVCETPGPVVTAPSTASTNENVPLTFTVSAADGGGNPIVSLTASPLPPGATFTANASNTSGTFSWTPTFTQAGTYNVTFTAVNSLSVSGSAATAILVVNVDRPPVVTAPAFVTGDENVLLTFVVQATDPDGDAITSLTAAPLPPGATFTVNGTNTSGTFSWTPSFAQAGTYSLVITASNALSGAALVNLSIGGPDRAPVVLAPATVAGSTNTLVTFTVSAADPDGDPISSLTAAPLPPGATFTVNPTNTSGTFLWTSTFVQAGTYTVTFTASNALSGSANTVICIDCGGRPPVVQAPASVTSQATLPLAFTVLASDPDGDAISSLTAAPLPSGATFTVNASNTSGTFSWTPTLAQVGSYTVTFTASNTLSGSATTSLAITRPGDNPPVVSAPASATGVEGAQLTFMVTASDPDGDPINSLTASFLPSGSVFIVNASNTSGTFQWTPATGQAGTYFVTFTAKNLLSGAATTAINITADLAARVFTTGANKTIKLSSNRALWCADIEPVNGDFAVSNVIPSSVVLISPGTGSVGQISAVPGKTAVVGDQDNNGIQDVEVCFLKGDLRLLFSNLTGKQTVTLTLEGNLVTGSRFRGALTIDVNAGGGGGALAASVTRDASGGGSTLFFATTRGGAVRVRVFDVSGRLVRSLVEDSYRPAGNQSVRFDGRADDGRRLASGIYLFRIEAAEGTESGRFAVLR